MPADNFPDFLRDRIKSMPFFPFLKIILDAIEALGNGIFIFLEGTRSLFDSSEKRLKESKERLSRFKHRYDRASLNILKEFEKRVSTNHRYLVFPPLGMAFLFATHFLTLYPLCRLTGVRDRGKERPFLRTFGLTLTFLSILAYNLIGHYQQRRSGGNPFPLLETTALVKSGPYRYTRNPMLLVKLLALAGIGLALNSMRFLSVVLPLYAAGSIAYVRGTEEPYLREKFGEEYDDYVRKTSFLIPGL